MSNSPIGFVCTGQFRGANFAVSALHWHAPRGENPQPKSPARQATVGKPVLNSPMGFVCKTGEFRRTNFAWCALYCYAPLGGKSSTKSTAPWSSGFWEVFTRLLTVFPGHTNTNEFGLARRLPANLH